MSALSKILRLALLPITIATLSAAPSIAVTEFTSEIYTTLRHGLPEGITEHLVNSGLFEVYERDKLEMVMQEQSFQSSGFVDTNTAAELGRMIGVQYILTGNIVEFGKEVKKFSGYGVRTSTTFHRLRAGIKVIEVETGRIVFSKTGQAEQKVSQSQGMRSHDETIDTQLAAEVAENVVSALLASPSIEFDKEEAAPNLVGVTISSTPENADIEVDGIYYGNTGGEVKMEEGLHTVVVSLPGYITWSKKVMVREGLSFNVTLAEDIDEKVSIEVK